MWTKLRAIVFRAQEKERLREKLKSMGVTETKRGRKRDINPYLGI